MRIRIAYTVTVDRRYRRALNRYYGRSGLATREQVRRHCELSGNNLDDDITYEYDNAVSRGTEKAL